MGLATHSAVIPADAGIQSGNYRARGPWTPA